MTSLTAPIPAHAHSHHTTMTSHARHHEPLPAMSGSREQFHRQMAAVTAPSASMNLHPGS